jgi:hypothetical protein
MTMSARARLLQKHPSLAGEIERLGQVPRPTARPPRPPGEQLVLPVALPRGSRAAWRRKLEDDAAKTP